MENANSYEYLEKIKIAVIENLKRTAAVPSVQMQDVPRQSLGMSDDQDAELDDQDEDENQDVRLTQRQWEKRVERQDEFEESDDEDMARANGVFKPNGHSLQETNFRDINNDDTMEVDSGAPSPAELAELDELVEAAAAADLDETMIDEAQAGAAEPTETTEVAEVTQVVEVVEAVTEADKPASTEQRIEAEKPKVDEDGDVDMAEAATGDDKVTEATIKKEEVEGISATEAEPAKSPAAEATKPTNNNEAVDTTAGDKQRASGSPEAAPAAAKPAEEAAPATEASAQDAVAADNKADDNEAKA